MDRYSSTRRARPVEIGAVLEDHVDEGVAEVGEAPDRLDLRRAQQRRDDRVGDLVLDDVRGPVPARVDDDLGVGEVGQGVEPDLLQDVHGEDAERRHAQQDEQPVPGRELDDPAGSSRAPSGRVRPAGAGDGGTEAGLRVEQEVGPVHDRLARRTPERICACPSLREPDGHLARLEAPLARLHVDDLAGAGVEDGRVGDEDAFGRLRVEFDVGVHAGLELPGRGCRTRSGPAACGCPGSGTDRCS